MLSVTPRQRQVGEVVKRRRVINDEVEIEREDRRVGLDIRVEGSSKAAEPNERADGLEWL